MSNAIYGITVATPMNPDNFKTSDPEMFHVSYNLVNAVSDNYVSTVNKGDDFEVSLTALDGYAFTSLKVIHNGEVVENETYNKPYTSISWSIMAGNIIGSVDTGVQGDIAIIAVAEMVDSAGEDGKDGEDGFSPIAKVTQTSTGATISITDKSGTTTATIFNGKDGKDGQDGYTPQKNVDYFDGKDGTSATHSWNGTILTITSASGTSSANLKGDKGDKGDSIKGDTGSPGADGVSPTVAVSKSGKVTTVSITDKNGTKTATINDGADGSAGKDGTSVTVKNVSESTADGGSNVVTFSDGKTLTIKNGKTGGKGADGYTPQKGVDYFDGSPGKDGSDGADGQRGTGILNTTTGIAAYTTAVGGVKPSYRILLSTLKTQSKVNEVLVGDAVRYSAFLYPVIYVDSEYAYMTTRVTLQGTAGSAGKNGTDGKDGADGYTPVKGVDYWTAADQEAIIQQVIDAMGGSVVGTVDANNNIVFRGYLANGAYTLKYEDADGNIVDCGTITVSANESGGGSGGNDSGMGDSGSIPLTWSMGVKLDKNTGAEASGSGYAASSHVELVDGYAYTFNQLDNGYGNTYGGANICYYDASGNGIGYELLWDALSGVKSKVLTPISGAKTFRVRLYCGESTNEGVVRAYFTVTYAKV